MSTGTETKTRIKDAFLAQAKSEQAGTAESIADEHQAAEPDTTDPYTEGDQSQADEAGDLVGIFEKVQATQDADVATIADLDVSPTDTVRPGALVEFDGGHYLVGIVGPAVEVDGVSYEGLSGDSPLYAVLSGKRAGDTFSFRDKEHTLDSVS